MPVQIEDATRDGLAAHPEAPFGRLELLLVSIGPAAGQMRCQAIFT